MMDFSLANPSLDLSWETVTKKGDNIAAYTVLRHADHRYLGQRHFIFSPRPMQAPSSWMVVRRYRYTGLQHLLGGVTVDFRNGGASGLAVSRTSSPSSAALG